MKKSLLILTIITFTMIGAIIVRQDDSGYVTSKYSKYCYVSGNENKNIKVKIHFKTLEACAKPLK